MNGALAPELALPGRTQPTLFEIAWRELQSVARYRGLVRYLVRASLKTENTATFFGFIWWLLDPLLLIATYVLLIDVILHRGAPNYPIFLSVAVLSWEFFSKSARNSMALTLGKQQSMKQVAFPRAVIPLSATLAESLHFLFALTLLVVCAIPFGIDPQATVPFALVIGLVQFAFTLGVAFFFAALNMLFRDTNHLSNYVFRMWFYLSPGLYAVTLIPEKYRRLYDLNPFATFFDAYRRTLLRGELPHLTSLAVLALASVAVAAAGYLFFVRHEPSFVKVD